MIHDCVFLAATSHGTGGQPRDALPSQYCVGAAPTVGRSTPSAPRRKGAGCTGSGAPGASAIETPCGQSPGQMATMVLAIVCTAALAIVWIGCRIFGAGGVNIMIYHISDDYST